MRLIDADELMKALGITDMDCEKCEWQSGYGTYCSRGGDFEDACFAIENAPTIEPERKTGKWIEKDVTCIDDELDDRNVIDEWQAAKCSVCGKWHTTPYLYSFKKYAYCPNCGADMRGEQP